MKTPKSSLECPFCEAAVQVAKSQRFSAVEILVNDDGSEHYCDNERFIEHVLAQADAQSSSYDGE